MEVEDVPNVQSPGIDSPTPDSIDIDPEIIMQEVVNYLTHNIPIQAVDLLLEANMIETLVDMKEVDQTNVWKICQYLLRIVYFHYETEEREKIYHTVYKLFSRFDMWVDRLVCAISMKNDQFVIDTFNECTDEVAKKQICEVIAKSNLSHLIPLTDGSVYAQILSSANLADWYEEAAKLLSISTPRTPSQVLSIPPDRNGTVSEKKQASQAVVNGLINLGHCSESYFKDETGRWADGFEKNKDIGLFLAAASMGTIHMWSPYLGLNSLLGLLSHSSADVRIGARFAVGLVTCGLHNPSEDLALNTLYQDLSLPLQEKATKNVASQFAASLLALALAYANSARDELIPFLLKGIQNGPMETAAAGAIASGLIFKGRRQEKLLVAIADRLIKIKEETEENVNSLMLGLGYAMLYTGCQQPVESFPEVSVLLSTLPTRYAIFLETCITGCSYLGSQNIIVLHQLLEKMTKIEAEEEEKRREKREEEKKKKGEEKEGENAGGMGFGGMGFGGMGFGGMQPASSKPKDAQDKAKEDNSFHLKMMVMAIAMIAAGEHVNEDMITRTLELLLVYASKSVTEVVLLAIALLNVSKPSIHIIDQVMRKTAGGGQTNKSNSSSYRNCVNAVLALGLISAGSNNSKVNTHLKQVVDAEQLYASLSSSEFASEKAFFIHFAQGLTGLGRGLATLSPVYEDGQLFNPTSFLFLLVSLMPRLCNTSRMTTTSMMYLMMMLGAARPRCLLLLDSKHEDASIQANVRVGQAVDTTGQAGNVRNVSGFQTLETPVLLAPGERAVMVDTDMFKTGTHYLEGFVFVEEKKKKQQQMEEEE